MPATPTRSAAVLAQQALRATIRATGRGLGRAGAVLVAHRRVVLAVAVRVGFWAALVIWLRAAVALLGPAHDPGALAQASVASLEQAQQTFAIGTAICVAIVLGASATRLRLAGGVLGTMHGASAVVLWLLAGV